MDPERFDSLTRSLAAPRSRRGLLGGLGALVAGLLGARAADAQVTQAQCGNRMCKNDPGVCTGGCVCCVYGNGNSRCRPPGTCSPGEVLCPAGQALGPSGVCVAPTTTTPPPTTTTPPPTTTTTTTTSTTSTTTTTAAPTTEVVHGGTYTICHASGDLGPCPGGCSFCVGAVDGSGNYLCLGSPEPVSLCDTNVDCPAGWVCQSGVLCHPPC